MINNDESVKSAIIERETTHTPPRTFRSFFIGRPLSTADAPHQTIGKAVGLAVFASDALSSTAYATQEILGVIAAAGAIAYGYLFPISLAIVTLLAIVTISYEQTIHAYPGGGGAYIVARDNLGEIAALVAGSSLLIDYILLAAVAVSSGSACSSSKPEPSHVLAAIGIPRALTGTAIRFGLGRFTTADEVSYVTRRVAEEVTRLRALRGGTRPAGNGNRDEVLIDHQTERTARP